MTLQATTLSETQVPFPPEHEKNSLTRARARLVRSREPRAESREPSRVRGEARRLDYLRPTGDTPPERTPPRRRFELTRDCPRSRTRGSIHEAGPRPGGCPCSHGLLGRYRRRRTCRGCLGPAARRGDRRSGAGTGTNNASQQSGQQWNQQPNRRRRERYRDL